MRHPILLAAILLSACSTTQQGTPASPEQTVRAALDCLYANDAEGAMALFYVPPAPPQQVIKDELTRHAKRMSSEVWGDDIIESKVTGDFAVVVVREKHENSTRIDLDPFFLLRTPDGWKLSPEFTDFMSFVGPKGEGRGEYEELMKWYKDRKEVLKREMAE